MMDEIKAKYDGMIDTIMKGEEVLEKLVRRYGVNDNRTRAMLNLQDVRVENANAMHDLIMAHTQSK